MSGWLNLQIIIYKLIPARIAPVIALYIIWHVTIYIAPVVAPAELSNNHHGPAARVENTE